VTVTELDKFEEDYKKLYSEQLKITSSITAWRKKRRDAFTAYLPKGRQARPFKTSDIPDFIKWVTSADDSKAEYSLWEFSNLESFNFVPLLKSLDMKVDKLDKLASPEYLKAYKSYEKISANLTESEIREYINNLSWIPLTSDLGRFTGLTGILLEGEPQPMKVIDETSSSEDD